MNDADIETMTSPAGHCAFCGWRISPSQRGWCGCEGEAIHEEAEARREAEEDALARAEELAIRRWRNRFDQMRAIRDALEMTLKIRRAAAVAAVA